jgi:hypothetical protein
LFADIPSQIQAYRQYCDCWSVRVPAGSRDAKWHLQVSLDFKGTLSSGLLCLSRRISMTRTKIAGVAFAVALSLGVSYAQPLQVGQDLKNAGHDTADAGRTVGHDTAHGTKVAARDTEHGTKVAARDTEHGTKVAAHKTAHVTRKAAHKTAHGTRKVAHKVEGKPDTPANNR